MDDESAQPAKPRFCEVCQQHHLDYQAMQTIADKAGVPKQVVDAMSVSVAVRRAHATTVLTALQDQQATEPIRLVALTEPLLGNWSCWLKE